VHRLFSAFISIIGLLLCFSFILKILLLFNHYLNFLPQRRRDAKFCIINSENLYSTEHKKSFACFASLRFNFKLNSNKIFNLEGSAIKNKKLIGALYLLCSLFPAYFLHTNFVLKESIMMLYEILGISEKSKHSTFCFCK